MANTWLKTIAFGNDDDLLNNPIVDRLSEDPRSASAMQNILASAGESGGWLASALVAEPDNPEYVGKEPGFVFSQELKNNPDFRHALVDVTLDSGFDNVQSLFSNLQISAQDDLSDLIEGKDQAELTALQSEISTLQGQIQQLEAYNKLLENDIFSLTASANKAPVQKLLRDASDLTFDDGQLSVEDRAKLVEQNPEVIKSFIGSGLDNIDSLKSISTTLGGIEEIDTAVATLENPVMQGFMSGQSGRAFIENMAMNGVSGTLSAQTVLSGVNANPVVAKEFMSQAIENPDAFKALVEQSASSQNAQNIDVNQYAQLRNSVIDVAIEDPAALENLLNVAGDSLTQSGVDISQAKDAIAILNNEFVAEIAGDNPELAYMLADPANGGDYQKTFENYIKQDTQILAEVKEAYQNHPQAAEALAPMMGEQGDMYLSMLEGLDATNVTTLNAIGGNVQKGMTVEMAAVSAYVDPLITLAKDTVNPDAQVQAGQQFVDMIAEQAVNNPQVQENVQALQGNEELMQAIGQDFATNGQDIKNILAEGAKSRDFTESMDALMKKYPEMGYAAVPIMAAGDPQAAVELALDGMKDKLLDSVKGLKGQELTDAKAYINDTMNDLANNGTFTNSLGERLADPEQAQNLMENMSSLDKMSGAGGFDGMKIVLEDLKQNPNAVMDILVSDQMMGRGMSRWGPQMVSAKIGSAFDNIGDMLSNLENSPFGDFLASLGFDIRGMIESLDGFESQVQDMAGPMMAKIGDTMTGYQVAGGIMNGVRENKDAMASEGMVAMNSGNDGFLAGVQSQLGVTSTLAEMSVDAPAGWAERQARNMAAHVGSDGVLYVRQEDGSVRETVVHQQVDTPINYDNPGSQLDGPTDPMLA